MKEKLNSKSSIKKTIGVMSGKGGVGKSLVTSLMAVLLSRRGHKVGILDADITGPSIPKAFGLTGHAEGDGEYIYPVTTKTGIDVMSINLLLESDTDPVVWRGPVIAGAVKQFYTEVVWKDIDFLLVDMPPGTGDVPLTVFQSVPLDGIIVVTSPQELVSMGVVENMSYAVCPDCGKEIKVFGESHIDSICRQYGLALLGRLPIDPKTAKACDSGLIELFEGNYLEAAVDKAEAL